jgi:hypothetical protein
MRPYYETVVTLTVSGPDKTLVESCGKQVARAINTRTSLLLKLAKVRETNTGFDLRTTEKAKNIFAMSRCAKCNTRHPSDVACHTYSFNNC